VLRANTLQGVDALVREQHHELATKVAAERVRMRWAENAQRMLHDETATCVVCLDEMYCKPVALRLGLGLGLG